VSGDEVLMTRSSWWRKAVEESAVEETAVEEIAV
jgi:hypothetical protein